MATGAVSTPSLDPLHAKIRERLVRRKQELAERERRVARDLARSNEPLVADFSDQAIQTQNDEPLQVIGRAAHEELEQINAALQRLDAGTYGVCGICGEPIAPARLDAVPYATTCAECAREPQR